MLALEAETQEIAGHTADHREAVKLVPNRKIAFEMLNRINRADAEMQRSRKE